MENNIKKKDPFEKVIILSAVSIVLCILLLSLTYLVFWGYYRHSFTSTPTNVLFSLVPIIIFGCFIGTLAVYNFTSFILDSMMFRK